MALPLVPLSSVAEVARKSAGATLAQFWTVTEGTSGEDSRKDRPSVSARMITPAIVPSLRMS